MAKPLVKSSLASGTGGGAGAAAFVIWLAGVLWPDLVIPPEIAAVIGGAMGGLIGGFFGPIMRLVNKRLDALT